MMLVLMIMIRLGDYDWNGDHDDGGDEFIDGKL